MSRQSDAHALGCTSLILRMAAAPDACILYWNNNDEPSIQVGETHAMHPYMGITSAEVLACIQAGAVVEVTPNVHRLTDKGRRFADVVLALTRAVL